MSKKRNKALFPLISAISILFLIAIIFFTWFAVSQFENEYVDQQKNRLNDTSKTIRTNLDDWIKEQNSLSQSIASSSKVLIPTQALSLVKREKKSLINRWEQTEIRNYFSHIESTQPYTEFSIISLDGTILFANSDAEIGLKIERPILEKLNRLSSDKRSGLPSTSIIFSELNKMEPVFPYRINLFHEISNLTGKPIAFLRLRIDPSVYFEKIASTGNQKFNFRSGIFMTPQGPAELISSLSDQINTEIEIDSSIYSWNHQPELDLFIISSINRAQALKPFQSYKTLVFKLVGLIFISTIILLLALGFAIQRKHSELLSQKEAAEHATTLKDKFVSLVAHDLKNPLAAIEGYSEILLDETDVNEMKPILKRIRNSTEKMVTLIDSILGMSRIRFGKIIPLQESVNINTLFDECIEDFSLLAAKKGIKLEIKLPENYYVFCDPKLTREVFNNLFANSVKFCQFGDTIRVYSQPDSSNTIIIEDTGAGIPTKNLQSIFEFDSKTTTLGTHGETGTGFGLPLCRELIESQGGSIKVESSGGKGTRFHVKFKKLELNQTSDYSKTA